MHMIENFSKDHYQYIIDNQYSGPPNPSGKKRVLSQDDDDLLSHGSIKQISKGANQTTLSGKNTTKIVTNDEYGEESKEVEDEDDINDSQTRLNKELEGVQREKPRPKTAGNKVDDENVFYKRPNVSNAGYKTT